MRRFVLVMFLISGFVEPQSAWAGLSADEIEMRVVLDESTDPMVETLDAWVAMNTGTWNIEGLVRFAALLKTELEELGFDVELVPGPRLALPGISDAQTGPVVLARRAARTLDAPSFLLNGHYDTVFEANSEFQRFELDPNREGFAVGPGVSDMKGGIVVMLHALRVLHSHGDLDRVNWTILLNSDEEIGSFGSRPLIEREARAADVGFVFEAARGDGAVVKSRRGLGQFHIGVNGIAAHAGSSHAEGRSAIHELSHKVLKLEALTDYSRGVTVNVGSFHAGTKRNIVPDRAESWVDLRFDDPALGEEMRREIENIANTTTIADTSSEVWGRLHRPPKIETPTMTRLLGYHASVTQDLGLDVGPPVHAGGGTDGSLMAAVGLATLDSMGVQGGGAHTGREFIELASLSRRAAIAAILMRRLMDGDRIDALRAAGGAVE